MQFEGIAQKLTHYRLKRCDASETLRRFPAGEQEI